jgi:hypothetical protein
MKVIVEHIQETESVPEVNINKPRFCGKFSVQKHFDSYKLVPTSRIFSEIKYSCRNCEIVKIRLCAEYIQKSLIQVGSLLPASVPTQCAIHVLTLPSHL